MPVLGVCCFFLNHKTMKREYLFKAKDINSKDWIYGMPSHDFRFIFNSDNTDSFDRYEVLPKTICEFIGLKNKSGHVFENDIIQTAFGTGVVFYDSERCAFRIKWIRTILEVEMSWLPCKGFKKSITIGNNFDTTEFRSFLQ